MRVCKRSCNALDIDAGLEDLNSSLIACKQISRDLQSFAQEAGFLLDTVSSQQLHRQGHYIALLTPCIKQLQVCSL
jgi:hypothetical protein